MLEYKKNTNEIDTMKQITKLIEEHVHYTIAILVDIVSEFNENTCTFHCHSYEVFKGHVPYILNKNTISKEK